MAETQWRVLEEIGRGGFCIVHAAQLVLSDGSTGPVIAVKSLIDAAGASPETVARFQREARLLDDILTHPNIVPVLGRNLSDASPFFFMEKANGNLAKEIATGRWRQETWAINVFRQILAAMSYAHEKNVIHRDLKPENALVFGDTVKVTDFGLGKHLVETGTVGLTKTNHWWGTEPYMAPEQFNAMKDVGPEADVFALGKLLMVLLTGEVPVVGAPDVSEVPEKYRYFISRCCHAKAENRYKNARDASEAFERINSPVTTESADETLARLVEEWFEVPVGPDLVIARRIDELLRTNAADEKLYTSRVPQLPGEFIDQYMNELPAEFSHMLAVYDDHVSGGLPFEYCDVVTDFYLGIFRETSDVEMKTLIIRRLFEMGASHSRWYVRTELLTLLAEYKDSTTVAIAEQTFKDGGHHARAFYAERAASFAIPQRLRVALL